MLYSIYRIRHQDSNKVYLGFTSLTADERFDLHVTDSKRPKNSHLHRAIAKYGREAFEVETIYQSKDQVHTLETMEPFFISEYRAAGFELYNIQDGGRGYKNNPRSKQVEIYDVDGTLVRTFKSQSEAARELKRNLSSVINACRNADLGKASKLAGYWACFVGSKPVVKDTSYLLERNNRIKPFLGKKRPEHSLKMIGNQNARKK